MSKQTNKHKIKHIQNSMSTWCIKKKLNQRNTKKPRKPTVRIWHSYFISDAWLPARELTYRIPRHFLKMIFLFHPLPNMGYVRSLEGNHLSNQKTLGFCTKTGEVGTWINWGQATGQCWSILRCQNQVITKKQRGVRGWWFQPIGNTLVKMRILPK